MIDPSWKSQDISLFGGAKTLYDPPDVRSPGSLQADNSDFVGIGNRGQVRTRLGFLQAFNANEAMTALYNWISGLGNYLVWFKAGTGVRQIKVTDVTPAAATVYSTASGHAATFSNAGARLYGSIFGTDGKGAAQAFVVSYQSAAFVGDKLFPPPMTYVPGAPTEPGAGRITPGVHRLGYAVEYRHHGPLRLSPDSGVGTPDRTTFQFVEFTATGSKNLQWILNPTAWPADAVRVHIVMAPVVNPDLYIFVPGANAAVTGGGADSKTITFNISDNELLNLSGDSDASEHLLFRSQTTAGAGPFNPSVLFPHGDRMVYITTVKDSVNNDVGAAYISNRNAYQQVTDSSHRLMLPGQRDIISGCSVAGGLFFGSQHETYMTYDNGADPVNWPVPKLIDGRLGTLAPRGMTASVSRQYGWVADESGIYLLTPSGYGDLPISYEQTPEWQRINWSVAHTLQIADYAAAKKVLVLAALDTDVTPGHIFMFDYTNGMTAQKVDFSLWYLASYAPGCFAIVQNALNGTAAGIINKQELWLGPSTTAPILRQATEDDTNPYRDNGQPIQWIYDPPFAPERKIGQVMQHHGWLFRAKGAGNLNLSAYKLDGDSLTVVPLRSLPLSTDPKKLHNRFVYLLSEASRIRFQTDALDAHCVLSFLRSYFSPYATHR